jgi:transforming growth factor-beta-induced protein
MNLNRFFTLTKRALLMIAVLTTLTVTSCKDDEEPKPTKTIWQLIQENSSTGILETQMTAAGFDTKLNDATKQYTLFAPSDAAMNALLSTLGLSSFESVSSAVVKSVLNYHIANSQYLAEALTNNTQITTEQGEKITVLVTGTGEKKLHSGGTTDAKVTTSDIKATNGVVHIVDAVMVPPTIGALIIQTLGTVAQPILLSSNFTILAAGLQKADAYAATTGGAAPSLTALLISAVPTYTDGLFTVFAPTNATFNAGSITAETFTGQQWYGIISNHIVYDDEATFGTTADFAVGDQFTTFLGSKLTVISTTAPTDPAHGITTGIALNSDATLNTAEAQIAVLDVLAATGATPAENGIINVIAGVLKPQ